MIDAGCRFAPDDLEYDEWEALKIILIEERSKNIKENKFQEEKNKFTPSFNNKSAGAF